MKTKKLLPVFLSFKDNDYQY